MATIAAAMLSQHTSMAQARRATLATGSVAELRSSDAVVDRMTRAGDLRIRRTDADTMLRQRHHERLAQYYQGIPVYGGGVSRQIDAGSTVSIFGTLYSGIAINTLPGITAGDAAALIKADIGADLGPTRMPALVILPEADTYRLTYHATAFSLAGSFEYFIDAHTGLLIKRLDAVRRQSAVGRGLGVLQDTKKMSVTTVNGGFVADDALRPPVLRTYDMRGNVNRTMLLLNGIITPSLADWASDSDNDWLDQATVDAHTYSGYTYDYYFKRFGRRGLDDRNIALCNIVHPAPKNAYFLQPDHVQDDFYTNAGYYGGGMMLYGEGLPAGTTLGGQSWNYLAGGLDVVGHELSHGVIDYSSALIYEDESGALNESFADMMGTAVEAYFQASGNGPLRADYLIGEDVVTPGGLRSMENPGAFGDPDHYSHRFIGTADNGGVHTNSGIGNHWFYLAIEGGTNRTSGLPVAGVGRGNREQIERIAYRAFTQLLSATATYASARAATIQAARDLYGANSTAERAITQAWTAVGVQ